MQLRLCNLRMAVFSFLHASTLPFFVVVEPGDLKSVAIEMPEGVVKFSIDGGKVVRN